MDQAACKGLGRLMFPETGESTVHAKRVCRDCTVLDACREYALTMPALELGVWAGMSETERQRARRNHRMVAA